jgi:hypothetical protein
MILPHERSQLPPVLYLRASGLQERGLPPLSCGLCGDAAQSSKVSRSRPTLAALFLFTEAVIDEQERLEKGMDFRLSEEEEKLRKTVEAFVREELIPLEPEFETAPDIFEGSRWKSRAKLSRDPEIKRYVALVEELEVPRPGLGTSTFLKCGG